MSEATPQDAEKELLKLLDVLNDLPQGASDGKKLSAKFAERLGFTPLAKAIGHCLF